jgi:membrane protein DedA with SNARE-associated domain
VEQTVLSWLAHFGPLALFALLTLGVFGLPIPDETVLVLAGLMVSRGQLRALPTVTAGIGGAMVGITVSYAVGRFAGLPLLLRYGTVIHVSPSLLTAVGGWFNRFGKWLLTAGYFVPGVRHLTAVVAGASGLSAWTFSLFAYAGSILWVSCFLALGYFLGDEWRTLVSDLHRRAAVAVVVAVAVVACYLVWKSRVSAPPG